MMVLIKSAQDLLNDLSMDDLCSREYRNRAEAWLCLKQECEECLAPDLGYGSGSIDRLSISDEIEAKSLDVIGELSVFFKQVIVVNISTLVAIPATKKWSEEPHAPKFGKHCLILFICLCLCPPSPQKIFLISLLPPKMCFITEVN